MRTAEPNWADKTIWTGDNLHVMRGMNSESVDLIYLDPPFNSKANYAAPIGSAAAGAAFKDTWTLRDVDAEWINFMESRQPVLYRVLLAAMTDSDKSYLAYMAVRMLEMHRILKPTGTIYLHCDPTMSHYLKLLLDAVFGKKRFRNEVIWSYRSGGGSKRHFGRKHDVLLLYTKSNTWTFNADDVRIPYDAVIAKSREHLFNEKGKVLGDVWDISRPPNHAKEWVGYPTQKPLSLLQRIVTASSNPGDIVFDPFCGCATTLVAADDLQRSWVGIDISEKAADLVMERIEEPSRAVPRHSPPLGHPPTHRPRPDTRLQQHREPQAPLRRTGRRLRSMQYAFRRAASRSGPHHRCRQRRHPSSLEPATALRPLQPCQRRPRHGVPTL